MTSPTGASIIAVSCHTVDGQGSHKVAGPSSEKRLIYKGLCATNIIQQVVERRKQRRAPASSQGQPSIIICGDLNVTSGSLKRVMGTMKLGDDVPLSVASVGNLFVITDCVAGECAGLPHVKGPDKQHDAGFFDVSVAKPCGVSSTMTDVWRNNVNEQTKKAQQSSSRGSSYNRCRRAMAMVAAMMATLVGQGRPWSTRDDQIQLWSTLSDQGRPSSTRVDPGRAGSTLVDQRRSVSTRVDHGRPGSTLVDQGRSGSTLVHSPGSTLVD